MGKRRRLAGIAMALLTGLLALPALADTAPVPCSSEPNFENIRSNFFAKHGPTPAAPATMIVPADGGGRMLFKQPMGADTDARSFRVFEVSGLRISRMTGSELRVLAIDPADGAADDRFKPTDSVSMLVDFPRGIPWQIRSFAVLACKGDAFSGWGVATAPVSNPIATGAICASLGLLLYVLAMLAVFADRKRRIPGDLATKYPAVFGARILGRWEFWNPIHLITNAFNQGSVQKLQVVLFSFLIGELVLSLVLRTGALVDVSATVVALLGISGIGAAAAQVAYQQKTRLSFENWSWLQKQKVLRIPKASKANGPFWRDLVMTNREFDVYKLQTIIFTVAVASAIVVSGASHLSSFSVPQNLLGVLGLSQVVYVGGVMVKPPAIGDLDDAITRLRAAAETLADVTAKGTDTDAAGKALPLPLTTGQPPGSNALRQYNDLADQVEAMIESALEVPANREALDPPSLPPPPKPAAVVAPPTAAPPAAAPAPANTPATRPSEGDELLT